MILTRPENYRKKKTNALIPKIYYRKYPGLVSAVNSRYLVYNRQLDKVNELPGKEDVVIRPSRLVNIKRLERKMLKKYRKCMDLGRETPQKPWAVAGYLNWRNYNERLENSY